MKKIKKVSLCGEKSEKSTLKIGAKPYAKPTSELTAFLVLN